MTAILAALLVGCNTAATDDEATPDLSLIHI